MQYLYVKQTSGKINFSWLADINKAEFSWLAVAHYSNIFLVIEVYKKNILIPSRRLQKQHFQA